MKKHRFTHFCGLLLLPGATGLLLGDAPPAAIAAFDSYSNLVESRLARQHPVASDPESVRTRLLP